MMNYLNGDNKSDRNKGLIGTILLHVLVAGLFLLLGLSAPYPPPADKGVLINFGTAEIGKGERPAQKKATSPQQQQQEKQTSSEQSTSQEEVMTQEQEPAPAIQQEESEGTSAEQETGQQQETQKETQEQDQPEVNPDALYKKSDDTNDKGQGTTSGQQNQGDEKGKTEGSSTQGGQNAGKGGTGIGYSLAGRSLLSTPRIDDKSQETGKVVIKIKVNQNGEVISADYSLKGSTTSDPHLVKLAKRAARQTTFNADANAPQEQFGSITFDFKLR